MSDSFCQDHPTVATANRCSQCGRSTCEVCTFFFAGCAFCPSCATAGPTAEERSKVFSGGLLSVGLAVLGFVIVAGLLVTGATGVTITRRMDTVISTIWLACSLIGIASGLVAREGARRTGSLLPVIGFVANGLLIAVQAVFIVGSSR